MNKHSAAEDDAALSAYEDDDDEDATSREEEEEIVGDTQPAQQQQLPVLTSPITDGGGINYEAPRNIWLYSRGDNSSNPDTLSLMLQELGA